MKKIAMIGATDRYNYGDLLFPLIVQKELSKRLGKEYSFHNFSTSKSDLSKYGGLLTEEMSNIKNENIDVAIVVGGEVLSANWKATYYHIQSNWIKVYFYKILFKLLGERLTEYFIKFRFHLSQSQKLPWLVDKNIFKVSTIIYNTVSGTDFSYVRKNTQALKELLVQSDYLSVRDEKTKANIDNVLPNFIPRVFPDSAFLMSDSYPVNELKRMVVNSDILEPKQEQKTVVFQVGKSFAKGNETKIAKQLELIYQEGWRIVLLPIGYAALHEDSVPLKKIKKMLPSSSNIVIQYGTIFDIMYTIATADMFIGTSLHGNITALSYGVPSIALDQRVEKLSEFLRTFGITNQRFGVDYGDIFSAFKETLLIDHIKLSESAKSVKQKIAINFDEIATLIKIKYG